jgi:hypothetical protein
LPECLTAAKLNALVIEVLLQDFLRSPENQCDTSTVMHHHTTGIMIAIFFIKSFTAGGLVEEDSFTGLCGPQLWTLSITF